MAGPAPSVTASLVADDFTVTYSSFTNISLPYLETRTLGNPHAWILICECADSFVTRTTKALQLPNGVLVLTETTVETTTNTAVSTAVVFVPGIVVADLLKTNDSPVPSRTVEELAEIAYTSYCATTDFKDHLNNSMPAYHDLPETAKSAWRLAVCAVPAQ